MPNRRARRAAAHNAVIATRRAARLAPSAVVNAVEDEAPLPKQLPSTPETIETQAAELNIPEPGYPFPSLASLSTARLEANKANAQLSTGPTTPEGRERSSQNRATHGLARHHKQNFKLLTTEDAAEFEAFKQSLFDEHQPATPTESLLVNIMVESHWLADRALRLQDNTVDPDTGSIAWEQLCKLYLRYQAAHRRAFHKALSDLLKLRAEKRKADRGFEAQKIATEKHEMKKQTHYWDVLKKDGAACYQMTQNTLQYLTASADIPGFEAQYNAELLKRGVKHDPAISWMQPPK